jgi:hypothetical protein
MARHFLTGFAAGAGVSATESNLAMIPVGARGLSTLESLVGIPP